MSVDMALVAAQIENMAAQAARERGELEQKAGRAVETLRTQENNIAWLRQRIGRAVSQGHTTWLVAGLNDSIGVPYPTPATPSDFAIVATDGSQIAPDRHFSTHCFLINIGAVLLQYGSHPDARLENWPSLYFEPRDVTITGPPPASETRPIEGAIFAAKRAVEECRQLVETARPVAGKTPLLAVMDGSLVLWALAEQGCPDFVIRSLLADGMLKHLAALKALNEQGPVAVASYISFPRSTEVVNALRLAICPQEAVDCDRCPAPAARPCDAVAGVLDRELFRRLLAPGERSALFSSLSSVVRRYYDIHETRFFYLNTGEETARVEIPAWVAGDAALLDLTHALVLDQCARGGGYPVALSEAHEQAVVTAADTRLFWDMVDLSLTGQKMSLGTSAKSMSKRARYI